MSFADPRRYGAWTDAAYTMDRTRTEYIHEYGGNAEAGRRTPARTSALYDGLAAKGASFLELAGWEAPDEIGPVDAACRAAREGVAVMDVSALARFELSGPDAAALLDSLCAGRIPRDPGGVAANPVLSPEGRLAAFLLVAHPGPDRYYVTASAVAEAAVADLLARAVAGRDARLENLRETTGTLLLSGPRAAGLLGKATGVAMTDDTFPPFTARAFAVGGIEVLALRVAAVGGAGFELHAAMADLPALHAALRAADPGLVDFGWRAFDSLRLERGFARWGVDIGMTQDPQGAGLGRYIAFDKGEFTGRAAFAARQGKDPERRLCLLALKGAAGGTGPEGSEAVWHGGKTVGLTTSGGQGHTVGRSLALAALPPALTVPGTAVEIELYGKRHPAEVIDPPVA
jgi:dimethylglycine dehydrogenase